MPIRDKAIAFGATRGVPLPVMIQTADMARHNLDFGSQRLAISDAADLRFGVAPKPLTTRQGLTLGGGLVYPELNFTLPPMFVNESTMPEVRTQYQQIITGALQRAVELETPGLVVEFETLPPMTENPAWGIELTRILLDAMAEAHAKHSLKSVLRITPNDTREMVRPPRMRSGLLYEAMLATFDGCAAAGAELLSKLMLPIIHIRAADGAAGRLGALLAMIGEEAQADRPGGQEVLERLLEIVLVEALRRPGVGWDQARGGSFDIQINFVDFRLSVKIMRPYF